MTVEEPGARRGYSPATSGGGAGAPGAEGRTAEIDATAEINDGATEEAPPPSPSVLPAGAMEQDIEAIRREKR
jgi:hypothetical protein